MGAAVDFAVAVEELAKLLMDEVVVRRISAISIEEALVQLKNSSVPGAHGVVVLSLPHHHSLPLEEHIHKFAGPPECAAANGPSARRKVRQYSFMLRLHGPRIEHTVGAYARASIRVPILDGAGAAI